jgi:chemotaxis protein methyltransferase CheR
MELHCSDQQYQGFRDLVLTRAGLHYPAHKRADLLHGLSLALDAGGYTSLDELYAQALSGGSAWDLILAHLTIGETYFFRNGPQFDALRESIIPDILRRRADTHGLRVWSAGCATGEEPYSLAMTIRDLLPDPALWHASILATDINPQFLERARTALYSDWSFRETSDDLRARFWIKEQNRWRLRPEIRHMVMFARLNLAEPSYPSIVNGTSAIDLLVCRNVTIYFDQATTRQVVERFYKTLVPGGWLIVGHSEPQASMYQQFEVHNFPNTVVYRKPLDAPMFGFDSWRGSGPEFRHAAAGAQALSAPAPLDARPAARRPSTGPLAPIAATPATARSGTPEQRSAAASNAPAQRRGTSDLSLTRVAEISALIKLGRQCADRGDWSGAETYCHQALANDSLCIEAHYLLGQIHEHQGALDLALAAYRRTVYLDRSFVPGQIGIGNIWRQMGRIPDASRCYEIALRQLALLPATALIPGIEGATAGELAALVGQQLRAIGRLPADPRERR